MLDNGAVNRTAKVGVLVRDCAGLVADTIVYILNTAFAHEVVAAAERNLDDCPQLCQFSCRVGFDVCNSLYQISTVYTRI